MADEKRTLAYTDVVRVVLGYYRERGQMVDFRLNPEGAIVAAYRVRDEGSDAWKDLLPVGVSAERYQKTIQDLAPILFPGEDVRIKSIVRHGAEVTVTVAPPEPASASGSEAASTPY